MKTHYNTENKTTILDIPGKNPTEYKIFGAICFPSEYERDGEQKVSGFALVAGQNVNTKKVRIFSQQEFLTIENILNGNLAVTYKGLASWFNKMWADYYARKYFYHQPIQIERKHRLEILRSKVIQPNPMLIDIDHPGGATSSQLIWRYLKTKNIVYEKDSDVHNALRRAKNKEIKIDFQPEMWALQCLLLGFEKFPFAKKKGE
jgi:hypothetical protein